MLQSKPKENLCGGAAFLVGWLALIYIKNRTYLTFETGLIAGYFYLQ